MAQHLNPNTNRRGTSKAPIIVLIIFFVVLALVIGGLFLWKTGRLPSLELPGKTQVEQQETEVAQTDTEPAANVRATPFNVLLKAGEIHSIRLVGDSITAGFGTEGYVNADEMREGTVIYDDGSGTVHYETSQAAACWANAFRAWAYRHDIYDFVNAGINGAQMKQLAERPRAWLGEGADVIVVALGTNDAGYYGPDVFEEDARKALEAAAAVSKLVVVLSPVNDLRSPDTLVESAASLGDILARICNEEGYLFSDDRPNVTPEMFIEDGLHPNTEGSIAIWGALQRDLGIEEVL